MSSGVNHRPIAKCADPLVETLEKRWDRFDYELSRSRRRCTESAIHEVRVAMRRLLANLELLQRVMEDLPAERICRRLKKTLKKLGPLRDTQLLLASLQAMEHSCPGLKPVRRQLRREEQLQIKKAEALFENLDARRLKRSMIAIRQLLRRGSKGATSVEMLDSSALELAVAAAFQKVMDRYEAIRPSRTETIHRLRIAFKQFRYMVESLPPQVSVGRRQFRQMQRFQRSMGDIQDLEVVMRYLKESEAVRELPARSVAAVRRRLMQRRRSLIGRFLKTVDRVAGFWPPADRQRRLI